MYSPISLPAAELRAGYDLCAASRNSTRCFTGFYARVALHKPALRFCTAFQSKPMDSDRCGDAKSRHDSPFVQLADSARFGWELSPVRHIRDVFAVFTRVFSLSAGTDRATYRAAANYYQVILLISSLPCQHQQRIFKIDTPALRSGTWQLRRHPRCGDPPTSIWQHSLPGSTAISLITGFAQASTPRRHLGIVYHGNGKVTPMEP